jgi:hypothetical protein
MCSHSIRFIIFTDSLDGNKSFENQFKKKKKKKKTFEKCSMDWDPLILDGKSVCPFSSTSPQYATCPI